MDTAGVARPIPELTAVPGTLTFLSEDKLMFATGNFSSPAGAHLMLLDLSSNKLLDISERLRKAIRPD